MLELTPTDYQRISGLFEPLRRHLSVPALIAGNNPGKIYVDNLENPQIALAATPEGSVLVGDPAHQPGLEVLKKWLQEIVFTGNLPYVEDEFWLNVYPEKWGEALPDLIPTHDTVPLTAYHYLLDELRFDWRKHLPDGYSLRQMDRAFFDDSNVVMSGEMEDWFPIEEAWGSLENFLAKGTGFCVMYGEEAVARCQADCVVDEKIELGIITEPDHRNKGLAALVTAATVEYCLENGFKQIGWHCVSWNTGSWKTAEKVGFRRAETHTSYSYQLDSIQHMAGLGWYFYQLGEYEKTAAYYTKVLEQRKENPLNYYQLAAMAFARINDVDQAMMCLSQAVERGWAAVDYVHHGEVFIPLHDHPEWENLLQRMRSNTN